MSNLKPWEASLKKGHEKFISTFNYQPSEVPLKIKKKATQELGFAYQSMLANEQLQKCDPSSIVNAISNIARTSITLNPVMKLAYLVPRNGKCVLDFSYMGLISLLKNNGNIRTINAYVVFEDEEFQHDIVNNIIYHTPKYVQTEQEHNARTIIGAYSVAKLPNGEVDYSFMPMWEIDKVRKSSKGSDSKYSPWNTWRDEMIKKTVIKRHFKMLISIDDSANQHIASALEIEQENNPFEDDLRKPNSGKQKLSNAFIDEDEVKEQEQVNVQNRVNEIIEDAEVVEEEPKVEESKPKNTTKKQEVKQEVEDVPQMNEPQSDLPDMLNTDIPDMDLFNDPNQLTIE